MSKQFKWLSILVAVLAVALLAVMPTAAAPALVAGTIALDKTWATAVGTTVTVTVTDADLNMAVAVAGETSDYNNVAYAIPAGGLANTAIMSVFVKKLPLLDRDGNGVVNRFDVVPGGTAPLTTYAISPADGRVDLQNVSGATIAAGTTFNLTYAAADVNNTVGAVKVYSTTDTTGFVLTLNETGPNSGVFTATFKTAAATKKTFDETVLLADLNGDGDQLDVAVDVNLFPASATRPELIAGNGATVTAAYTDAVPSQTVTVSASVETTGPAFSNLSPASGYASSTTTQTLFVDVTDAQSGVVSGTIVFSMGLDNGAGGGIASNGILEAGEVTGGLLAAVTPPVAITGGFRGQQTTAALGEGSYVWSVTATDNAGNVAVLDLDSVTAGAQAVKLKIDTTPPTFVTPQTGETGEYWDAVTRNIKTNKTTSVSVQFSEALDGTTVDKTDFTVAGATPIDAFWTADILNVATIANYVFLTVPAMAPDAKPSVVMVGAIKDKAGNSMVPNVTATLKDGIAPTLTAALDKTLTKDKVVLTIVSNEALGAVPTVPLEAENPAGAAGTAIAVPAGANQWTWTYTPGVNGSYVVKVAGTDTSGKNGALGVSRCTALAAGVCTANADYATTGIAFEVDTVVDDPTVTAGGIGLGANPSVYTANPYIVVDFTVEASEYGFDAATSRSVLKRGADGILGGAGVADDNVLVTGTDTRKKATISTATLDGTAIVLNADAASVKFIYAASGLALGEHTLVLNYADEAANVRAADLSLKFTIKARPSYSIPLVAGMNLMSFPATPEKPALKDAFAGTAADLVVTYDPSALAGPWLIAQKGADGTWTGTLASVDNLHGYWVRSTGVASISVNIPDRGFQDLPPSLPVAAGWNLVPVISISGGTAPNFPLAAGTAFTATAAFSGLPGIPTFAANLPFGYSFNPLTGDWTKLLSGGNITVGSAYWVYATAKGTITP